MAVDYITAAELKATLSMTGLDFADADITTAITAASRSVDAITGRRFYPDADANQVRYYTSIVPGELWIDDLITLTTLKTAPGSDRVFNQTWAATDYLLEPVNADDNAQPWTTIRVHPSGVYSYPSYTSSVEITGKFGWTAPPAEVKQATSIIAAQLVLRARQAPFGIIGGIDSDAVRLNRFDPQLEMLLGPFKRGIGLA